MKKLSITLMILLIASSLLLSACGGEDVTTTTTKTTSVTTSTTSTTSSSPTATTTTSKPDAEKYGGVYKYPLAVAPATPLGYPVESAPDITPIAGAALERLLLSGDGGFVEPLLATRWDIDIEAATMTFYLREGIKFHDGSDFNADVVKWNFDLYMEAGKAPNWVSVDVIDDHTIMITLKVYQNTSLTGMASFPIISKASYDEKGIEWVRENPIGTGPFIFVEHERDARISFTKNESYWREGLPYLDGIDYIVIADVTVRKLAFKRGDIHEFTASGLDAKELQQAGYRYIAKTGGTFVLIPDSKNPDSPFHDIKVRKAVSHAIDRESLAASLGYGFMRPAYQVYPGFEVAYIPDLDKHEYNPELARQLLTEAGYPEGFQTTIHTFVRIVPRDYINAIAYMLSEVGIQTQPDFPEAGKYTEYRFNGWNNAMLGHCLGNFDNINSFHDFYFGELSFPSLEKPESWRKAADASLASKEVDPALVKASIKAIHDEVMIIPYLEETVTIFFNKGAYNPGLEIAPQTQFWTHLAWLEPEAR